MIFLLNRERVVAEVLELARRLIASRAKLDLNVVEVSCGWKEDRIVPTFAIKVKPEGALEAKWYQEAISETWAGVRPELYRRLQGLSEVRYGSGAWFRQAAEKGATPG